jgi:hypothetical protein
MDEVQIYEVNATLALFNLAQQWVGIGKDCLVRQKAMRIVSMVT